MVKYKAEIASVVILYNPKQEVLKNIIACAKQTEIVYVLDNSENYHHNIIDEINNRLARGIEPNPHRPKRNMPYVDLPDLKI